jgi:hypothetical protein
MLDLRELFTQLRIKSIEHRIVFALDHSFFTVLIERLAIAAYVVFDTADAAHQLLPQCFKILFDCYKIHGAQCGFSLLCK